MSYKYKVAIKVALLEKHTGQLLPGENIENRLLELYKYDTCGINNTILEFTNIVLKHIYKDNIDRPYNEIYKFYNEQKYLNIIFKFLDMLAILIINKARPNIVKIEFIEYTTDNDGCLHAVYGVI